MKMPTRKDNQYDLITTALVLFAFVLGIFVTGVQAGIWWHRTNIDAKVGIIGQVAPRP